MSAWGVEPRVPFLDADFLDIAMNLDPEEKMIHTGPDVKPEDKRIEKWAMRKAFDTPDDPYLPKEILWRQKEQFSDGKFCFRYIYFCLIGIPQQNENEVQVIE